MGHYDLPLELRDTMHLAQSGRSLIVASDRYIEPLRIDGSLRGCDSAVRLSLPVDAPIPGEMLRDLRVLVLEVDPTDEASLHRLAKIRVEHPGLAVIVALHDASVSLVRTLVRQGVADVAELPFAPDNLATQILDALSSQIEREAPAQLAPMISVVQATGGSGATTTLTHLAEAIARHNPGNRGVCLVDLDLQGGDIASYLGLDPKVSVDVLLEAGSRLDAELMRSALTPTRHGFDILAAPDAIRPMDHIGVDPLLAVIRLARSMFDFVLVDLPPHWTNWSLSAVNVSERIVLVSDTSIAGLRQAKRKLKLFDDVHVQRSRVDLVVNRLERKIFRSVNAKDVEGILGGAVAASLAAEPGIRAAQDEGHLLTETAGKSRFAADIDALAQSIVERARAD